MGEDSYGGDGEFDCLAEATRLQKQLDEHFTKLARRRVRSGLRVFAFEHGLNEGEFAILQTSVRWLVGLGERLRQTPLPLTVFIADIGYRYDGRKFWPLFFEETPGWCDEPDSRVTIKNLFKAFAHIYSGAKPTDKWSIRSSNICWPVCHAVLPRVFQDQLVYILYSKRRRLTFEVISDIERLGRLIGEASKNFSDRFRSLVQNHALIGQIATALLTAEGPELADDHFLLASTVRQIVGDLSQVTQTRLRKAQEATRPFP